MFKWLARLLVGPADRQGVSQEFLRNPATDTDHVVRKPATVHLPPTAPRPDIAALQAKFAKEGSKKRRRHDKRGRGPQLPRYPNGVNPGGRH